MKTCTVTYCDWTSYGSMMQSIGLQKTLHMLDVENVIIIDGIEPISKYKIPISKKLDVRSIINNINNIVHAKKISKKYHKALEFIKSNISIEYLEDYTSICKNPPLCDCFIAGSDQIWHPDLCNEFFFLNFVKDGTKKISYAASMGKTNVKEENKKKLKKLVNGIDKISVRESDNVTVIRDYTDKDISVNIDPTFLLSAEQWRKYENKYNVKGPYILVYAIYWDLSLNKQLKELSKKTGLKVIAISSSISKVWADKYIYDVGPAEFLWLIDNAEYVISSSFHGVAFSTIFNKKFSAVINPSLPSRITNLVDLLSIPVVPISELSKEGCFDYSVTNCKIMNEMQKSIDYLSRELNIEK